MIAAMIDRVKASCAVDGTRVGVAGFSAGAAMATIMACTYPDRVRRPAAVAGVMYEAATTSGRLATTATACRSYTRSGYNNSENGQTVVGKYVVTGLDHRWSGGRSAGGYTDACAPDASQIIVDFFGF